MLRSLAILATATLAMPPGHVAAESSRGAPPHAMVGSSDEAACDAQARTGETTPIAPGPSDVAELRQRLDQVLKERLGNDRGAQPSGAAFRVLLTDYYTCDARAATEPLDRATASRCIATYQAVKSSFLSPEEWNALRADPLGFGGEQGRLAYLRFAAWQLENADAVACMRAAARAAVANRSAAPWQYTPILSEDQKNPAASARSSHLRRTSMFEQLVVGGASSLGDVR